MRSVLAIGIGLLLAASSGDVAAQPEDPAVNGDEFKCMSITGKTAAKFVALKNRCVVKCLTTFWDGAGPEADCLPPYGGKTAFCVSDSLKGAEAKARLAMERACSVTLGRDCPECYDGGDCSAATGDPASRVAALEAAYDALVPQLFCERAGAFLLEKRCQKRAAKGVTKALAAHEKCHNRCFAVARKLGQPTAPCLPPATDPDLLTCLAYYEQKVADYIDHDCGPPPASPDGCVGPYPDGAEWANAAFALGYAFVPTTYCASPSGAFIEP